MWKAWRNCNPYTDFLFSFCPHFESCFPFLHQCFKSSADVIQNTHPSIHVQYPIMMYPQTFRQEGQVYYWTGSPIPWGIVRDSLYAPAIHLSERLTPFLGCNYLHSNCLLLGGLPSNGIELHLHNLPVPRRETWWYYHVPMCIQD